MEIYDNMRVGFQRLRPVVGLSVDNTPDGPRKTMTEEYKKFIQNSGPYYFFITITFGHNIGDNARFQCANALLHRYNQMMFGRDYKEKGRYIKGFAFIEDHLSRTEMADRFHLHLLIKDDTRYYDFDLEQHEDIFHKASSKVLNGRDRKVFNYKCIDLQEVYKDDGAINYCMKSVWDKNTYNIKTIGVDGLSDNEFKRLVTEAYLRNFRVASLRR